MKKRRFSLLKKTLYFLLILFIFGTVFVLSAFTYYPGQIPAPSAIIARQISESTKIYDHSGNTVLYDVHGEEKRTIISWDQIPDSIKKATLASEDSDFYKHRGVDFLGILRAVYKDLATLSASQG